MDKNKLIKMLSSENEIDLEDEKIVKLLLSRIKGDLEKPKILDINEHIGKLKEIRELYEIDHHFTPGSVIKWKGGLKNRKMPQYGEPVIVLEVLDNPIIDTEESRAGSPYFKEPLNIKIGIIADDNSFLTFYNDSKRFEPIK